MSIRTMGFLAGLLAVFGIGKKETLRGDFASRGFEGKTHHSSSMNHPDRYQQKKRARRYRLRRQNRAMMRKRRVLGQNPYTGR